MIYHKACEKHTGTGADDMDGKTKKISIKADKTGMVVCIDEIMSAQDICCELYQKFYNNKDAFMQGGMVNISFRGCVPDMYDQEMVIDFLNNLDIIHVTFRLRDDTGLNIPVKKIGTSRVTEVHSENYYGHAPDRGSRHITGSTMIGEKPYIFKGNIHRKQTLEIKGNVIILGNVARDATVISGKSIIVIGRMAGTAIAGKMNSDSFILALYMDPQFLQIGDSNDSCQSLRHPEPYPMIATNDDNIINITYV